MTETLKPCRECGAPCSVQVFPNATLWVCIHNKKLEGGCRSDTAYLSAEDWNTRAPDDELAILRAEVTRLRQINAGNEAAAVSKIVARLRTNPPVIGLSPMAAWNTAAFIEREFGKDKDDG